MVFSHVYTNQLWEDGLTIFCAALQMKELTLELLLLVFASRRVAFDRRHRILWAKMEGVKCYHCGFHRCKYLHFTVQTAEAFLVFRAVVLPELTFQRIWVGQ